jgi:hypothetical protein
LVHYKCGSARTISALAIPSCTVRSMCLVASGLFCFDGVCQSYSDSSVPVDLREDLDLDQNRTARWFSRRFGMHPVMRDQNWEKVSLSKTTYVRRAEAITSVSKYKLF